jgi:nickel/cobalt transporter (NiCoT) family protein
MFAKIFNDASGNARKRVSTIGVLLVGANLLAWAWAIIAFHNYPLLMGTALLAYSFGLRHAVDADHIAAIDNVTRKLMQEGKRPTSVGLFFSLGHSTVVVLLSAFVAATTAALQDRFADLRETGSIISTSVSALFLFIIAAANMVILVNTWRSFQSAKRGERLAEDDLDILLAGGGLLCRLFRGLFRLISRSWHMYGLGLLFGLGFETATEVGLLGVSASGASTGLSPWAIMVFPALFSAGMALVDTADGILMLGAYGWAFVKPVRKLYYNLTITSLSVMVAIIVGGVETLGLIGDQFKLDGAFWEFVGTVNENFGLLGYGIIGIFVLGWMASLVIYKMKRYDEIEATI